MAFDYYRRIILVLHMRAQANRSEDKKYLKLLAQALDVSESRIKLDECGDWNIVGLRGKISTDGECWYLYTDCVTPRKWNVTKKNLSFLEVSQDGDWEGIFKSSRMPFRDEARAIRKVIGVRPRTVLTEEQRAALVNRLYSPSQEGVSSSGIR